MGSIGGKTDQALFSLALHEDGCDDRDVWEMRSSQERIVQGDDVTRSEVGEGLEGRSNRVGHRTKMNRNMSCLRNQSSMPIKKRTGKVPSLLNVGRVTAAREHCSHLLGDGRQRASQEFQADRIDGCFLAHVLLSP